MITKKNTTQIKNVYIFFLENFGMWYIYIFEILYAFLFLLRIKHYYNIIYLTRYDYHFI